MLKYILIFVMLMASLIITSKRPKNINFGTVILKSLPIIFTVPCLSLLVAPDDIMLIIVLTFDSYIFLKEGITTLFKYIDKTSK